MRNWTTIDFRPRHLMNRRTENYPRTKYTVWNNSQIHIHAQMCGHAAKMLSVAVGRYVAPHGVQSCTHAAETHE